MVGKHSKHNTSCTIRTLVTKKNGQGRRARRAAMKLRRGQASLAKFGVYDDVPGVSGWFGDGIFSFETRQSEQIPLVITDLIFLVQALPFWHPLQRPSDNEGEPWAN